MARIRLTYSRTLLPLHDADGQLTRVELPRLFCALHIGSAANFVVADGLVDTGSPLTVLPQRLWTARDFPLAAVRWLTPPLGPCLHVRTAAGTFRGRAGVVPIRCLSARDGSPLPRIDVVAQFLEDVDRITYAILGLGHGVFDGRRLVVEADANLAYLEDR